MPYYHVRITPKSDQRNNIVKLDLSKEDLEKRVLYPYRKGEPITFRGRTVTTDEIECIRINKTEQDSVYFRSIEEVEMSNTKPLTEEEMYYSEPYMPLTEEDIADKGKDVTDDFITGPPGGERDVDSPDEQQRRPAADARDVFVVHGRNEKARAALFEFLRSIGLHPVEWSEAVQDTGKASPYIGDILNAAFSRAHAVVVLLTPDDEARLKEPWRGKNEPSHEVELLGQARPNVLFEAGMAMGRDEDRTVLVEIGHIRPFSDIAGRHTVRLDNTSQQRQQLASRLKAAGCPVNLSGTDWHSAGNFDAAIKLNEK